MYLSHILLQRVNAMSIVITDKYNSRALIRMKNIHELSITERLKPKNDESKGDSNLRNFVDVSLPEETILK